MARRAMEAHDANYVGGDINGGIQDLRQLVFRPIAAPRPVLDRRARAVPVLVVDAARRRRPRDVRLPGRALGPPARPPLADPGAGVRARTARRAPAAAGGREPAAEPPAGDERPDRRHAGADRRDDQEGEDQPADAVDRRAQLVARELVRRASGPRSPSAWSERAFASSAERFPTRLFETWSSWLVTSVRLVGDLAEQGRRAGRAAGRR